MSQPALYSEILPPGAPWSMRIPRHRLLTLTALDPGANVSASFFNANQPLDRLNVPDTLKALHTAKLTKGHILMSDMGHALVSIVEDTLGWHDPLGGHITAEQVIAKFGERDYQNYRNDFYRNAHDSLLIELAKHGFGLTDIVANVNFFSKVFVDESGCMRYVAEHCPENAALSLRTEIDVLAVLSNTPHPMTTVSTFPCTRILVEIHAAAPPPQDDYCRNFRPECGRTLALTERLFL